MAWTIKYTRSAQKDIQKLDKQTQLRIKKFFEILDSPKSKGKQLTAGYSGLWRYRTGNYRIICNIQENELIVLVLRVGHRKEIYRRQ